MLKAVARDISLVEALSGKTFWGFRVNTRLALSRPPPGGSLEIKIGELIISDT